jgi:hypothetical protein
MLVAGAAAPIGREYLLLKTRTHAAMSALAWDLGWQCEQDLDEFSESLNSKAYQPQVELDSESSDELLGWIKKQR